MGLAQSVLVQMALKNGLGRKERLIPPSDFARYQKVKENPRDKPLAFVFALPGLTDGP